MVGGVRGSGVCKFVFDGVNWKQDPNDPQICTVQINVSAPVGTIVTINCDTRTVIAISHPQGFNFNPTNGTMIQLKADAAGQWLDSTGAVWSHSAAAIGGQPLKAPQGVGITLEEMPNATLKYKLVGLANWP